MITPRPDRSAVLPDEYRIRVYPGRSWFRHGWRVQVDSLRDWSVSGDQPQLTCSMFVTLGVWFPTREKAIRYGIKIAENIHEDEDIDDPLVIRLGPDVMYDERN